MACDLPTDHDSMIRINGVGEFKLENYGNIFIKTIQEYINENPVILNRGTVFKEKEKPESNRKKGDSIQETLSLLQQGLSVEVVAQKRKLAVSTITGHLEELLEAGIYRLSIEDYIGFERIKMIEETFLKLKSWKLTPVVRLLKGGVTYQEAQIVRGYMQGKGKVFYGEE